MTQAATRLAGCFGHMIGFCPHLYLPLDPLNNTANNLRILHQSELYSSPNIMTVDPDIQEVTQNVEPPKVLSPKQVIFEEKAGRTKKIPGRDAIGGVFWSHDWTRLISDRR
jgi:hypothetical protein